MASEVCKFILMLVIFTLLVVKTSTTSSSLENEKIVRKNIQFIFPAIYTYLFIFLFFV